MQARPYEQFLKLGKEKQYQMVSEKPQGDPRPVPEFAAFPEINFINLVGTQDKKPIKLATYRYPAQKTRGVVVYFHSLGYCVKLLANTAKVLANSGFTFVGYDQRGHGKSEGERGYLDSYEQIVKDAKTFFSAIQKQYSGVPIFLMGQGSGCLFELVFLQQFKDIKFAGLIFVGPSLKKPSNSKVLGAISDFALKLMPNKTGLFEMMFDRVVSNPNAVQFLKKDPDVYHGKVYVGTLMQMMQAMEKNQEKRWGKIETPPIVIVQGQYDKVADPINSINFIQAIKTKDKELWWYPNMWNNFIFQQEADQINARIVKWLEARI